eukprot:gene874-1699_t
MKNKKQNKQAMRAAAEKEERDRMLREISLRQKTTVNQHKQHQDTSMDNLNSLNDNNIGSKDRILYENDFKDQSSKTSIDNEYQGNKIDYDQICPNKKDPLSHAIFKKITISDLPPPSLKWDVLGPFPSGKLEVDADPTFMFATTKDLTDICLYILKLPYNISIPSEISTSGTVSWQKFQTKATSGMVEVTFNVPWGDLAQSIGNRAVFEFQGWARSVTYVRRKGTYVIDCHGVHTVYIRADNMTRVLTGDIYHSPYVLATVDLNPGPVGFVVPLRGQVQISFHCQISLDPIEGNESFKIFEPQIIPDLLIDSPPSMKIRKDSFLNENTQATSDFGLLLSPYLSIPVLNLLQVNINLKVSVEVNRHLDKELLVRIPQSPTSTSTSTRDSMAAISSIDIDSGQLLNIPLELYVADENDPVHLPCRRGFTVSLIFTSSRGGQTKVSIELPCRHRKESVLCSFLDHEGTVSTAALLFPLTTQQSHLILHTHKSSSTSNKHKMKIDFDVEVERNLQNDTTCTSTDTATCARPVHVSVTQSLSYPVMLTMHGTGVPARNQADAYKMIPSKVNKNNVKNSKTNTKGSTGTGAGTTTDNNYIFGVEGFWIVAPTRHGAHNWESIGYRSAIHSKRAIMRLQHGIFAGHSMGGHGALIASSFRPGDAVCMVAVASWIRKEEYGDANSFFVLDAGGSFVDDELKSILAKAMSDGHLDSLVSNLKRIESLIRVGAADKTTHPWYSRRIHRLLQHAGATSTYEEITGQGHWWWDTLVDNDGGVLNDANMRKFYSKCLNLSMESYKREQIRKDLILDGNKDIILNTSIQNKMDSNSYNSSNNSNSNMASNVHSNGGELNDKYIINNKNKSNDDADEQEEDHDEHDDDSSGTSPNIDTDRDPNTDIDTHRDTNSMTLNSSKIWTAAEHSCVNNFSLTVLYPPAHDTAYCGIQILQQQQTHSKSVVRTLCWYITIKDDKYIPLTRKCALYAKNVRRLRIVYDEGFIYGLEDADVYIGEHSLEYLKLSIENSLVEKTLQVFGPIRQLQNKPLLIVYGTPQDQKLRHAMRDLAIYLSNSYFSSHFSTIRIMSDLQFKSINSIFYSNIENDSNENNNNDNNNNENNKNNENKQISLMNILFVGGPSVNKIMRKLTSKDTLSDLALESSIPSVTFNYNQKNNTKSTLSNFCISSYCFDNSDIATIFNFPIAITNNPSSSSSSLSSSSSSQSSNTNTQSSITNIENKSFALAVCIHAVSIEGYLHMTRLAWPTVPPMVRAPFANYIPDYMVISGDIWSKGLGGTLLAGYWSPTWEYSSVDAYVNPDIINT